MNEKDISATPPACPASARQAGLNPWLKLIIGIALVLFFIFGIGTLSKHIPGAARMAQVIDERDLRATAIFYTDFEESAEGSEYIRHALESRPGAE